MYLIFDTNILLYIRGPKNYFLTKKSIEILKSIRDRKHVGVLTAPIIMELYYKISDSDSQIVANDFIKNLLSMEGMIPIDLTRDMGKFAGELYYKYNIRVKKANSTAEVPSACDCLLASISKFLDNSVICTNDNSIKKMSEITSDFLGIDTS